MIKGLSSSVQRLLVVTLFCAAVLTLLVLLLNPEGWWNWLRALAATSLSALLAVTAGVWLFNHQVENTEVRRKQQLVEALRAEITDIKNVLSEESFEALTPFVTDTGSIEWAMLADFELMTFDEVIRSGLFGAEDLTLIINLAGGIRTFNSRVSTARSIILAEIIHKEEIKKTGRGYFGQHNVDLLEQHRMKIVEMCGHVLDRLEDLQG